MADVTMTTEEKRQIALVALRQRSEAAQEGDGGRAAQTESSGLGNHPWLVVFLATSFLWLMGLLLSVLIPPFAWMMNFLIVLALWLWAKSRRLKPPTFGLDLKKLMRTIIAKRSTGGEKETGDKIGNEPPASDLGYILSGGGISPLIYLTALWWNNR